MNQTEVQIKDQAFTKLTTILHRAKKRLPYGSPYDLTRSRKTVEVEIDLTGSTSCPVLYGFRRHSKNVRLKTNYTKP